jgi:hypothetical protein
MTKPSPRDLVIKTSLNADEFIPFRDKCAAAGVKVSAEIRRLINLSVQHQHQPANRINGTRKRPRPELGRVVALFPCRHQAPAGARVSRLRL